MARQAQIETSTENVVKKQPTRTLTRKNTRSLSVTSNDSRIVMNKDKYINLFVVAIIWSLGGTANESGQKMLAAKIIEKSKNSIRLTENLTDNYFNNRLGYFRLQSTF